MQLDAGLDTGPMLLERRRPIGPHDTAGDLHDALAELGAAALLEAIDGLAAGTLRAAAAAGGWRDLRGQDRKVRGAHRLAASAVLSIDRQIRAFNPVADRRDPPGRRNVCGCCVPASRTDARTTAAPGTVLGLADDGLRVACGDGRTGGARAAARRQTSGLGARFRQRRAARGPEVRLVNAAAAQSQPPAAARATRRARRRWRRRRSRVHAVVHEGRSADVALEGAQARIDRAAVRAIALGTLRWYLRLAPALETLAEPAVRRAVAAARARCWSRPRTRSSTRAVRPRRRCTWRSMPAASSGESRASGVVNAVLRRFVAQRAELLGGVDADLARRHAHPRWLVDALVAAWGERAAAILAANNQHPPMMLAARSGAASAADDFLRAWRALGREAHAVDVESRRADARARRRRCRCCPVSTRARSRCRTAARSSPRRCSTRAPGMRVLDACAAPGGKTLHIAQRTPELAELVAVDDDPQRLQRVRENLERGGRTGAAGHRRPARTAALAARPARSTACWWTRRVRPPA